MAAPNGNENPKKGKRLRDAMHRALVRYPDQGGDKGSALHQICTMLIREAIAGDKDAAREVLDRSLGKATQKVEVKSENYHFEVSADPLTDEEWLAQANRVETPTGSTEKLN